VTRLILSMLGAICVICVLVIAIAYARRERPVPATRYAEPEDGIQGDPYQLSLTSGPGHAEWVN
jgi:hypothetical protein